MHTNCVASLFGARVLLVQSPGCLGSLIKTALVCSKVLLAPLNHSVKWVYRLSRSLLWQRYSSHFWARLIRLKSRELNEVDGKWRQGQRLNWADGKEWADGNGKEREHRRGEAPGSRRPKQEENWSLFWVWYDKDGWRVSIKKKKLKKTPSVGKRRWCSEMMHVKKKSEE